MLQNSLSEIKKELQFLDVKQLRELCLDLAKFTKDNKAFTAYQLFNASNPDAFLQKAKDEITDLVNDCLGYNFFAVKKKLQKIVKQIAKHAKFMQSKEQHAKLLMHFCHCYYTVDFNGKSYPVISNIYVRQLKKIEQLIANLHPDLQYDFRKELENLDSNI